MSEPGLEEAIGIAQRLMIATQAEWASGIADQLASLWRVSRQSSPEWGPGLKVAEKFLNSLSADLRREVEAQP